MSLKIIAEVGCNHKGDIELAREFIKTAAEFVKADVVKFQKRCNKELLSPAEYNSPHPVSANSYGATYGEHREFLEFSKNEHTQLMDWCNEYGVAYSTSVWDVTSAKEIISLNPKLLKVPSACNLNKPLLKELALNFEGEIHLSLGMTSQDEEEKIVTFFEEHKRAQDLTLYSCTSGYPVDFEDICLLEISRLREKFGKRVSQIGFSGHHLGIAPDIAALTLGATCFERHFTLDRSWKGTDHSASLEPEAFKNLSLDLRNVSKSLSYKKKQILDVEQVQRDKLKANQFIWS